MSLTYTDKNLKTVLHSWGRFRVTISEAVQPGDALSWLNSGADYTVQLAAEGSAYRADCFACEEGAVGDTIWAALAVELKSGDTPGTGGVVTRNYFAGETDDLGSPLYLGDEGKPSSSVGSTYAQIIGQVLSRDRIMLNVTGSATGPTFSTDITPDVLDGAALGTALLAWSDLFLANGAVINFHDGDVTITHSANTLTIGGLTNLVFGTSNGKIVDAATSLSIYGGNGSTDALNLYSQSAGPGNDYIKILGNSTMTLKSTSTITLTGGAGITLDPGTGHVTIKGGENLQLGTSSSTGGVLTCYKNASGGIGFRVTTTAITLGVPISAANDITFSANRHLLCSAGATYVDFSLGTGVFKTTSGTNYLNGNVTIAGSKNVSMGNATTKGGDFVIYRNTAGAKSFEVDVTTGIFMGDEVVFDRGRASYTMLFDVNKPATFLLDFVSAQAPLTALAADVTGDNTTHKLAIKIGASTHYLAVWGSGAWS